MKRVMVLVLTLVFFFWVGPQAFSQTEAKPLPTLELLRRLIQINTTNPPGNEQKAARFVKNYLGEFGIPSEIIISAPGRGNLIARLPGTGQKQPLMLLAHLDVVTADPSEWTHPPFEAVLEEPYLFGRGAVDMKGMAALMINTFVHLKLKNIPLAGDVLLVLVADEEAGGKFGAEFLVRHHWNKIQAGLVFNEGSIGLKRNGLHLYPVQVAEKGVAWLKLTASGSSGHGSMPIPDNATVTLIHALAKLIAEKQPIQKTAIVQEFLNRLAAHQDFPQSFILKHFFDFPVRQLIPWFAGHEVESDKILNAMVRNTVVPTVLKAGSKTNVIPAQAQAEVDCRILPGKTPQQFKEEIEKLIDDSRVKVELMVESIPNQSDFHTAAFKALEEVIRDQDPKAVVAPFISPGATDMRFFREKGILAYGVIPFLITTEELEGLHGKNERIPLAQIEQGENILWNFVMKVQGRPH